MGDRRAVLVRLGCRLCADVGYLFNDIPHVLARYLYKNFVLCSIYLSSN